ncbi:5883_t:CDS:2 [Entrophospora sp. SA101]|nr:8986_t:CDS:2 [Entrophospora sp. SA101]CAJ0648936.1 5883_t:CDS:2 [Entrophospora sp. SA101]
MSTLTSNEIGDDLFRSAKSKLLSLSNKNQERLDQLNILQKSKPQALNAISNGLETIPDQNLSGNEINNILNNLNSRRRNLNPDHSHIHHNSNNSNHFQKRHHHTSSSSSTTSTSSLSSSENIYNDENINPDITTNDNDDLAISSNSSSNKRKHYKSHPSLIINTKTFPSTSTGNNSSSINIIPPPTTTISTATSATNASIIASSNNNTNASMLLPSSLKVPNRLITPESSDSEFDISELDNLNTHLTLPPSFGKRNNSVSNDNINHRVARHTMEGVIIEEERDQQQL